MSLNFKRAIWKGHEKDHIEYCDLKTGNKFVQLEVKKKVKRVIDTKSGIVGGYKDIKIEKEILHISYPQRDVNENDILAKDKDQYYLVVNHTAHRAYPVLKSLFEQFYTHTSSGKAKGDSGLLPGNRRTNPEANKKLKGKNKEIEKRK